MNELHLAVTEWVVLDSLPFNMLHGEGFKRFVKKIDPKFRVPNNKTIKNIIADKYSIQKTKIKKLIEDTCVTATITTDLWTSRSKEGYIGVTCHWLSPDFEPIDILLAIEKMPYPHTNEIILNYLKNLVDEFGLSNKIICGVTDNGSNMQKAFDRWEGVERLPCTAHTLQLSINKALVTIKPYVKRFKRLVKFFSTSPKQSERLDKAQIEIASRECQELEYPQLIHFYDIDENDDDDGNGNYDDNDLEMEKFPSNNVKVLRNIASVKTRWNSSYISWSRLLKLRKSIQWLADTLPYEANNDSKKDARRLKQCLLQDYEWDLIEKILLLLKPFEEATTFFSGEQYPTLSLMYPTIQKLKIKYACSGTDRNKRDDDYNDGICFFLNFIIIITIVNVICAFF
jgi:hypothetical protein